MCFFTNFKKNARLVCILLFVVYIALLAYLLFLSPAFGRKQDIIREYNLVPLHTISNYILKRSLISPKIFITNIIGNVVAFMPMGFLIPIIQKNSKSFWMVLVGSSIISLFVEIMQYVFSVGSFDVDDVILNSLGGAVGYIIYYFVKKYYYRLAKGKNNENEKE